MISKPLDALAKSDIDALVTAKVPELRTLEYKRELPGNRKGERKEFLADISSFANGAGGHLIYGVTAERDENNKPTGAPEKAPGLSISSPDAEILGLDNLARDGIAPRIPGLRIRAIDGFQEGPVIIIHVPRSFAAPHVVAYQGTSRFYSRNSAGKYQLDVGEIRAAFAASEAIPERIRRFREERLARIIADETPVLIEHQPKTILHLFPVSAAQPGYAIQLPSTDHLQIGLQPMTTSGFNGRFNFDGYVTSGGPGSSGLPRNYTQLFRNGCIEAVEAYLMPANPQLPIQKREIPSGAFERVLIDSLIRYLRFLNGVGVEPPISVMLTLHGVKDFEMAVDPSRFFAQKHPIDRDTLVIPDILAESDTVPAATLLKPAFDSVWQAAGWDCSKNYDANGQWIPQ